MNTPAILFGSVGADGFNPPYYGLGYPYGKGHGGLVGNVYGNGYGNESLFEAVGGGGYGYGLELWSIEDT